MAGIGHTVTKLNIQYNAHVSSATIRIHCASITDYKWHVNLLLINVDVCLGEKLLGRKTGLCSP